MEWDSADNIRVKCLKKVYRSKGRTREEKTRLVADDIQVEVGRKPFYKCQERSTSSNPKLEYSIHVPKFTYIADTDIPAPIITVFEFAPLSQNSFPVVEVDNTEHMTPYLQMLECYSYELASKRKKLPKKKKQSKSRSRKALQRQMLPGFAHSAAQGAGTQPGTRAPGGVSFFV